MSRAAVICGLAAVLLIGRLPLSGVAGSRPAWGQPALYETHLPEGSAFLRFANATDAAIALHPDFSEPVALGAAGGDRISDYFVVENVGGRRLTIRVGTGVVGFQLVVGGFHTLLLTGEAARPNGQLIADVIDYNETRAKLSFTNADPRCAGAALLLAPSGRLIFANVPAAATRTRSVNPTQSAAVYARCGAIPTLTLDLHGLTEGGLTTVWLMAPAGTATIFATQDRIAPYQR